MASSVIEHFKSSVYYYAGRFFPLFTAKFWYIRRFHKFPNFKKPSNLNEYINWMKFYGPQKDWIKLADKYAVRSYVSDKKLDNILPQLYAKWDDPETIDISKLPQKFVVKVNNGSGDVLIVKDKSKITNQDLILYFAPYFSEKFGYRTAELHYTKMPTAIVAEELLDNDCEFSTSLVDYKFWCFNGEPEYVFVVSNREKHHADFMLYDKDWSPHPEFCSFNAHYREASILPKPKHFSEMLEMAKKLAEGYTCVRIDLYDTNKQVYFGEITFTSAGGYMDYFTDEFLKLSGSKLKV